MPRTKAKVETNVNELKSSVVPAVVDANGNVKRAFSRREKIELEMKIRRMFELEAAAKEHEKLKKELKETFDHVHNVKFGDFLVTGEERFRSGYVVQDTTFWNMKIIKL